MNANAETPDGELLSRAKARVGTTLRGKWHLDSLLGVGGMGTVYAATHRNGTRAAVKILHPELSTNPTIRQRFSREGQIANTIGHDAAVRVLDDDTAEDGSVYLVAELLEGETLEEHRCRAGGTLTADEVLPIIEVVLDVLAAAHDKGVVHRDLKPENVFLTRTGAVKLLDFGIARSRSLEGQGTATAAGTPLGTPSFMAPEQARGRWTEVDAKTDLWACGATLYTALTGRLLHEGATQNESLLSAMTNHAPSLASVAPSVPAAVAQIVDRALAYDKADRFADAREMQRAVRTAYQTSNDRPINTAPKPFVPERVAHATARGLSDLMDEEGLLDTQAALVPKVSASPTTGGNNVVSVTTQPQTRPSKRLRWIAVAGALGLLAGSAVVIALVQRPKPSMGSPTTHVDEKPSTVVPLPVQATPQPSESVSSTPPPATTASATAVTTSKTVPTAPTTRTKPSCNPPYTIDPTTGKKTWKVECL